MAQQPMRSLSIIGHWLTFCCHAICGGGEGSAVGARYLASRNVRGSCFGGKQPSFMLLNIGVSFLPEVRVSGRAG